MGDEYLNFEQASDFLNTPRSTLYRWLKEGRVPGHKLGRQWRFLRSELEAFRSRPTHDDTPAASALDGLRRWLADAAPQGAGEHAMATTHETLFWTAHDLGAQALHLQPDPDGQWSLMQRGAGALEPMTRLSAEAFVELVDELESGLPPEFRGKPGVRGAWKLTRGSEHMLVMHQQLPTALGPRWTFRLVTEPAQRSVESITRNDADLEALRRLMSATHGLVLISGASGSGKTTTAHTFLSELAAKGGRAIFALEPSTEFLVPGVNQVSVDLDDERAYRGAFSQVMHSDPDVLFLSSTYAPRHRELIYTTALNAAESGHLVLVQIEATSAPDALERFQAHVERPVDDWVVGVVFQELERPEGAPVDIRYEVLSGPLDVG